MLATVATNTRQTTVPRSGYFLAQSFGTAGDGVAFEISGIPVSMGCNGSTQIRVMTKEENDNEPGGLVDYLTNPEPLITGRSNAYIAPGGAILDPITNCWITLTETWDHEGGQCTTGDRRIFAELDPLFARPAQQACG